MKTKLLFLLLLSLTTMAQTNLVPNGNFETWTSSSQPANWYRFMSGWASQSSTAQNGSSSINMQIASGTFNFINSEYFAVQANKTYRITLYHRALSGTFTSLDFSVYHKPGTFKEEIIKKSDVTFSTTEWRKVEFEYTSTVNENIEVDVYTYGSLDSEILVDNISVVDINEAPTQYTKIPDQNFEKKLISLGIDSGTVDGQVATNSINKLTTLDLANSAITDVTGIEDFVSLTSLFLNSNKLTSINVSKNTALIKLNVGWNAITDLDVSNNVSLNQLSCYSNKLQTLNVTKNINLTILECSQNEISALDLSSNSKLSVLSCVTNKLTTLDTSKNLELTALTCFQNQITSLDVTANTKLTHLHCFSNKIKALDLSNNLNLKFLETEYNDLTTLDVSKNTALVTLQCNNNLRLESVNLRNGKNTLLNTADLSFIANPSLYCILVDDVAYANATWAAKKDASVLFSETECAAPKYTLIPDLNFEKSLIKKGIDGIEDGKVMTSKISDLKSLNLSDYYTNLKITDLTGIQDFTALEELTLPNNGNGVLTSIDVSHNLALKKLDCTQNDLSSIDVSNNLALTELILYGNNLTTLDVSKNLALTTLNCSMNRLPSIDVSSNIALTKLSCAGSNTEDVGNVQQGLLTSIDLSHNLALEYLDVSTNNKIVGLDISKNTKLTSLNVSNNKMTNVSFPENKLLKTLVCEMNILKTLDISIYPDLEILNAGYNSLTTVDITKHPNLKRLSLPSNELTNLDFSNNAQLELVYLSYNKLTTLDFSKNPKLFQIICDHNNLMKLNLKNGGNKVLDGKTYNSFKNNPSLSCITVDDVEYANTVWADYKDAIASYNTECGFSLPTTNFAIEVKSESCANEKNGEINITATAAVAYAATINNKAYTFTGNVLKVGSLAPGTYTIVITVPGEVYEQTFNVAIAKAAPVAGTLSTNSKKVNVEITAGTAPFTVFVDGTEQFQTSDASFSLELKEGGLIEVATSKACEGVYSKKINSQTILGSILSVYPNPTSGVFEIEIPTTKNEAVIELYNFGGQLVSHDTYKIENGTAKLNLENQPSGIYAAKIYLETPEYIKIIKK